MRQILSGVLVFVMLMPGLACGPFMSAKKAHAAAALNPPCHEQMKEKQNPEKETMLFKDCAKIDLYSSGAHDILKKPDIAAKTFFFTGADILPVAANALSDASSIRGPPPDWPAVSQTKPSILLTTLRFRE
jgi:hypothetical protein